VTSEKRRRHADPTPTSGVTVAAIPAQKLGIAVDLSRDDYLELMKILPDGTPIANPVSFNRYFYGDGCGDRGSRSCPTRTDRAEHLT